MINDIKQQQEELVDSFPTYKTTAEYLTGDPSATIYFHGLLCFSFNGEAGCEVGVNSRAQSHSVKVQVVKKGACEKVRVRLPKDFEDPRKAYRLMINVNKPARKGVYVFAPPLGSGAIDGRYSFVEYGIDLEGPEMYNRRLQKRSNALWPRFSINNGLFYTHKVSRSRFELKRSIEPGESKSIGKSIALVQAADIYLDTGGSIDLVLNDIKNNEVSSFKLPTAGGEKYEIAITNSCPSSCKPDPLSEISQENPTDFQLAYLAIGKSDPAQNNKFNLALTYDSGDRVLVTFGTCELKDPDFGNTDFCDPRPCLGMGCGRSPSLD